MFLEKIETLMETFQEFEDKVSTIEVPPLIKSRMLHLYAARNSLASSFLRLISNPEELPKESLPHIVGVTCEVLNNCYNFGFTVYERKELKESVEKLLILLQEKEDKVYNMILHFDLSNACFESKLWR